MLYLEVYPSTCLSIILGGGVGDGYQGYNADNNVDYKYV